MSTSEPLYIVLSSFPDRTVAEAVCRVLVEERLAACASLLPGITSLYHWQGVIEQSDECLVVIKTPGNKYPALQARLLALHPYDVPEIIALHAAHVLESYAAWAVESTSPGSAG